MFSPAYEHRSIGGGNQSSQPDQWSTSSLEEVFHVAQTSGGVESHANSDEETEPYARSTLADALSAPLSHFRAQQCEATDGLSLVEGPVAREGIGPLTIKNRDLVRECFTVTIPIRLPPDHATIALNQEQVSTILKLVANESARASFELLNSVVEKASRLRFGPRYRNIHQAFQMSKYANLATSDTDTDFVSEGPSVANQSETSRRAVSDDDF